MRDLIEHGFEIAMVRDATAGAVNDEGDGYAAAVVNWRFMAHALWTTRRTLAEIDAAAATARTDSRSVDTRVLPAVTGSHAAGTTGSGVITSEQRDRKAERRRCSWQ